MSTGVRQRIVRCITSLVVFATALVTGAELEAPDIAAAATSSDPAFETMLGSQAVGDGKNTAGVNAAVKIGTNIFFGGSFTMINGDSTKKYLAKYDTVTDTVSAVTNWNNAGVVNALATDGTNLFIGGSFLNAATITTADYLVKLDPSTNTFTPFLKTGNAQVTSGSTGYSVNTLVWDTNTLYVGGYFPALSGIGYTAYQFKVTSAASTVSTFTALTSYAAVCTSPGVTAMTVSGGYLYSVGYCSMIAKDSGATAIPYAARMYISSGVWDEIASAKLSWPTSTAVAGLKYATNSAGYPRAVAVDSTSNTVYVGGVFTMYGINNTDAGKTVLNGLMKASSDGANRTTWQAVTTGSASGVYSATVSTAVMSLTAGTGGVIVGGSFTKLASGTTPGAAYSAADSPVRYMARITNSGANSGQVTAFGGGTGSSTLWLNSTVRGVLPAVTVNAVSYFLPFGYFSNAAGIGANDAVGLLKEDNSGWMPLGATPPLNNTAYAVAVTNDNNWVYVGGDFTNLGGASGANYLAVYDRSTKTWSTPSWWFKTTTAGRFAVRALRISGSYIYIAGVAAGTAGLYVYRANATAPNGTNADPTVVYGTKIAAGGTINSLEFDSSARLVVGGSFSKVNETTYCPSGSSIKNLFRVVLAGTESCETIGSASPVGDAGVVHTLTAGSVNGQSVLAVGGNFTNLGGDATVDYVGLWDDSGGASGTGAWVSVGSVAGDGPVQNPVRSVVFNGMQMYVGGDFVNAGGDADADYLAAVDLNSNTWSDLGTSPAGSVYAMVQAGTTLYVGGDFGSTSTIADNRALFQVALAAPGASPSTSVATKVGQSGGSIVTGAVLAMARKRIGSGATADNYVYIGGTFTDLGRDVVADRIGLVHPTVNEISLAGALDDVPMEASPVPMVATSDSGLAVSATNDTATVCTWAANQITLLSVGACQVTFTQAGGSGYAAASAQVIAFNVLKGTNSIDFPAIADRAFTLTPIDPAVTASSGHSPSPTVAVSAGSAGVCTVVAGAIVLQSSGTCEVTASVAGDSNWDAAVDVTHAFAVSLAPQEITFVKPSEQEVGADLTLNATSSSSLTVGYTSSTPAVCTVSGAVVHFVAGGTCSVSAGQAGNSQFSAAAAVAQSFQVWPGSRYDLAWHAWEFPSSSVAVGQTASVRAIAQQTGNAAVTVEAVWTVTTPALCSVSATQGSGRRTLTALAEGTCEMSIARTGDASYRDLAARTASVTISASVAAGSQNQGSGATSGTGSTTGSTAATSTTTETTNVTNISNTYQLAKTGAKYKAIVVSVKAAKKGDTITKISGSPRKVCSVGNFGTAKKPVWRAVMNTPGKCVISVTVKTSAGKTATRKQTVTVKG